MEEQWLIWVLTTYLLLGATSCYRHICPGAIYFPLLPFPGISAASYFSNSLR